MLQRVREVLRKHSFDTSKIGGEGNELEVDETFVGGKVRNMHRSRRLRFAQQEGYVGASTGKTIVQGILDRNLRQVRAKVVPNVTRETLQDEILKNVKYGSTVYTDNAVAYDNGMQRRFVHDVVNKTEAYVRGQVHVNGMENFWSLLKRSLKGTYVAVEPFHLARYVDEQVFRYNNRATKEQPRNDAYRFKLAMSQVLGRRLTYSDLTGKSESPHHAETGTGAPIPF
jgi:transposase-like protein